MNTENKDTMKKFAIYFDKIYSDKNYTNECDFIKSILNKNNIQGNELLDLGCGTGNHALVLAENGFQVTGVDISQTAIDLANKKAEEKKFKIKFIQGDMIDLDLHHQFDICISMFSSLCYITDINQFKIALTNIYQHLKPDGVLIFDFWNGNTVINEKPSTKIKNITFKDEKIIRTATPTLNIKKQICTIRYDCIISKNSTLIDEFEETHTMRYHFADDLKEYLKTAGFKEVDVFPMIPNEKISENEQFLKSWYLFCFARK